MLVHDHWAEVSFSGLIPGLATVQEWRHSKVRSHIHVLQDVLKNGMEAEWSKLSYMLFLPEFDILAVEYF